MRSTSRLLAPPRRSNTVKFLRMALLEPSPKSSAIRRSVNFCERLRTRRKQRTEVKRSAFKLYDSDAATDEGEDDEGQTVGG